MPFAVREKLSAFLLQNGFSYFIYTTIFFSGRGKRGDILHHFGWILIAHSQIIGIRPPSVLMVTNSDLYPYTEDKDCMGNGNVNKNMKRLGRALQDNEHWLAVVVTLAKE